MEKVLQETIYFLQKGRTILYPTDTIWGLGCDATNYQAVERVFKIKRRKEHKSLIVLVDEFAKINDYVEKVPDISRDLVESIDTPLTIIFPKAKNLAKNVIGNDGSIAIRVTKDDFCKRLVSDFGKPIVSTSANVSGHSYPLLFGNISREIIEEVDYVVDHNKDKLMNTKASRIIKLEESGEFKVIRE